jgi:hypothetical protein
MTEVNENNIQAEIMRTVARHFQRLHADDRFWNWVQGQKEFFTCLLAVRMKVQRDAQRSDKNPIQFYEKYFPDFLQLPKGIRPSQSQELLTLLSTFSPITASADDISKMNGKECLKKLQILAQSPSGRKGSAIYKEALELKKAGKDINTICRKLTPNYKEMPQHEREREQRRMRSGIARLAKDATAA